jgi:PAS domain S-box-containing protein
MQINRPALQIAGVYALIGVVWTIFSDQVLLALVPDPLVFSWVGAWKGVVFIIATACLIYLTAKPRVPTKTPVAMDEMAGPGTGSLILVFAGLAGVILLLGLGLVAHTATKQRGTEIERLQAIADLKVSQVVAWFAERDSDAQMIRNDDSLVNAYMEWNRTNSPIARRRVEERLYVHKMAADYLEIALIGPDGQQISTNANSAVLTELPELRNAVNLAQETGKLVTTDLYRDDKGKSGTVHLDFIVPLRPGTDTDLQNLTIVMRTDPNRFLFPFIQSWPIPSASAETLLFRREGSQVLFLNELRHRSNTALRLRVPVDRKDLLAAQVLRGEISPGQPVEGADYREIPVLGVVKAIPGTTWFLVAKLDKAELYAGAKRNAGWIALADILALIVAAVAVILLHQREELRHALLQRKEHTEKLQALQLLEAIAEGATDAIYAKDADGRYLLLNRELCRFLGKSRQEILGHDDYEIFPRDDAKRIRSDDQKTMVDGCVWSAEESLPTTGGRRSFLTTRGPLHDLDGRVTGIFGIARDITERRFQDREIRSGEARFKSIFDGVSDGIVIHDLNNGTILEANAKIIEMFGYKRIEIRNITLADLSADTMPYTRAMLAQWLERVSHGESPVFPWLAQHKDGRLFSVEISMRRADVSGRACVLVLVRNTPDLDRRSEEYVAS